jgi:nucleoid-associated protein YgaU
MALTKAVIINKDAMLPLPIPVMFNPPEYQLTKTSRFAELKVPGLATSVLQYVGSEQHTLSMELFFDTTDTKIDVRTRTAAISGLTAVQEKTKAPPRLLLIWGSLLFPCVLTSVREHFDYFNALGMPLRARLSVEFKGYDQLESAIGALPLALVDQVARYAMKSGDTLQSVAAKQLGDPARWRVIARANGIENPRALGKSITLNIPGSR